MMHLAIYVITLGECMSFQARYWVIFPLADMTIVAVLCSNTYDVASILPVGT